MYDNKINSGQGYDVLKPSICILISNYNLERLKNIPKYHTTWNLREKDFSEVVLTDNIEMHILEIPKVNNTEIQNDELIQWLKFIENPANKEVQKFMSENKYLKQAKEELAYLSNDPDFELLVESRAGMLRDIECMKSASKKYGYEEGKAMGLAEGRAQGRAEGQEKGRQEGRTERTKQIAKKMKEKNMSFEDIIELTGLTKEEIEQL